jgi:hypothetical protein
LPAAEEEAAAAEEEAAEQALAEEVAAEEVVVAVSAILVEAPVHSKAVNPAVGLVVPKGEAKVPLGVQVVGVLVAGNLAVVVLVAGNLAVVVLAVFAILAEVHVYFKVVNPAVVQLGLEEVVKAEISEEEE